MSRARAASGRFVLRLSPELHRQLRRKAADQRISLNALCTKVLSDVVAPGAGIAGDEALGRPAWWVYAKRLIEAWGDGLRGAVLFGSAVRNELRSDSDIDLLLVLDSGIPLHRQLYRRWDDLGAKLAHEREINAHFVHLPQRADDAGGLWLEVAIEGQVLSDRDGQLGSTLIMLRRAIASGRFVRSTSHGQPFWRRAA